MKEIEGGPEGLSNFYINLVDLSKNVGFILEVKDSVSIDLYRITTVDIEYKVSDEIGLEDLRDLDFS